MILSSNTRGKQSDSNPSTLQHFKLLGRVLTIRAKVTLNSTSYLLFRIRVHYNRHWRFTFARANPRRRRRGHMMRSIVFMRHGRLTRFIRHPRTSAIKSFFSRKAARASQILQGIVMLRNGIRSNQCLVVSYLRMNLHMELNDLLFTGKHMHHTRRLVLPLPSGHQHGQESKGILRGKRSLRLSSGLLVPMYHQLWASSNIFRVRFMRFARYRHDNPNNLKLRVFLRNRNFPANFRAGFLFPPTLSHPVNMVGKHAPNVI